MKHLSVQVIDANMLTYHLILNGLLLSNKRSKLNKFKAILSASA